MMYCNRRLFYRPVPKSINALPDNVLVKVFSYLDKGELCASVMHVCKRWSKIAISDEKLIQNLKFEKSMISSEKICGVLQAASSLHTISLVSVPEIAVIIDQICR